MSDQFTMFGPMTSEDTGSAISSRESASGVTPCDSPDGMTTAQSGPAPAPASHSAWQAKAKRSTMKGIFGQSSFVSSKIAAPPSSSESKSQQIQSSDNRQCRGCRIVKSLTSFRRHNRNGYRHTCRTCENRWVRTSKPWDSDAKRQYQRDVRNKRRGLRLTTDAKQRAKARGIPFSLDWRDIQQRIDKGACEVTGILFDLLTPGSWNAPSLDQIVPGMGYTHGNTRVVLFALNTMAGNWGFSKILMMADALREKGIH